MAKFKLDRRTAIISLLAISGTGALGACGSPEVSSQDSTSLALSKFSNPTKFFSDDELRQLSAIADTIIPATDTLGALGAGVIATLQELASVWGGDNYRAYWREGLRGLVSTLNDDLDAFVDASADRQIIRLRVHDNSVFEGERKDQFYKDLKSTIVEAYYMSETGATEELAYEAVPGEWIACAPLVGFPKTWAT